MNLNLQGGQSSENSTFVCRGFQNNNHKIV